MKKYCCFVCIIAICILVFSACDTYKNSQLVDTNSSETYNKGNDTTHPHESNEKLDSDLQPEEPIIEISSAKDLRKIEDNPDGSYILTCHIDLSVYGNWMPICLDDNPFTGTLDGDGYSIKNLNVDVVRSKDIDSAGLFGCVKGATFKNLGISSGKINISSASYGGAAGAFAGASDVKCNNGEYILTSVNNCYVAAEVSSTRIENETTSYSATMAIGSFFGAGCADFTNCYSVGKVAAALSYADQIIGGFIGNVYAYEEAPMTIECCYNLGLMSGRYIQGDKPGAFLGYPHFSSFANYVDIVNSYYGTNANEYNTLRIAVTNNKDDAFTSVKGITIEQMQLQDTFQGFDFNKTWDISPDINNGYPYLKSQNIGENDDVNISELLSGEWYKEGESTPTYNFIFNTVYEGSYYGHFEADNSEDSSVVLDEENTLILTTSDGIKNTLKWDENSISTKNGWCTTPEKNLIIEGVKFTRRFN